MYVNRNPLHLLHSSISTLHEHINSTNFSGRAALEEEKNLIGWVRQLLGVEETIFWIRYRLISCKRQKIREREVGEICIHKKWSRLASYRSLADFSCSN